MAIDKKRGEPTNAVDTARAALIENPTVTTYRSHGSEFTLMERR